MVQPFWPISSNIQKIDPTKKQMFCLTQSITYRKFQWTMVGTHILSRYCVRNVIEIFFSNKICSLDYQNLLGYHTSGSIKYSSIKSQIFTLVCLISQKIDSLKSLLDVQTHIIKNLYLIPESCIFYRKIRVLVCYVNFHLNFTSLVIKLLLINLK